MRKKNKKNFMLMALLNLFIRFLKKKKSIKCNIYTYKINKLTQKNSTRLEAVYFVGGFSVTANELVQTFHW